jgi:hypothetical protein
MLCFSVGKSEYLHKSSPFSFVDITRPRTKSEVPRAKSFVEERAWFCAGTWDMMQNMFTETPAYLHSKIFL